MNLKEIRRELQKELGLKNPMAVSRVEKVVFNIGLSKALQDPKFLDVAKETLRRITGQQPILTTARKSISNFRVREGLVIGAKVTLRGKRMYDFLEKLIRIALPRMRDFRGISKKSLDQTGNLNLGFAEHIIFPEIRSDEVEKLHGLEIAIHTTAKNREEGFRLLSAMGFPFQK